MKRILASVMATLLMIGYLPNISVSVAAETRKIEVWDFGGVEEAGSYYHNNITLDTLDKLENVTNKGAWSVAGDNTFGSMILNVLANDRMYNASSKNYGASGLAAKTYSDGYASNGIYYANGTGGEARRCMTFTNVVAGDKITIYSGCSDSVDATVCFKGGSQLNTSKISAGANTKHEFIAENSGSYKVYYDATAGKPIVHRAMQTPGVTVSGSVNIGSLGISGYGITFANQTTGGKTEAVMAGNSFSAVLTPGYTYTASMTGATGFGFTNASKTAIVPVSAVESGAMTVSFVAETKSVYTATGSINGFAANYSRLADLSIKLTPPEGSLAESLNLTIDKDKLTYSAILEPDVEYTASLIGVNDYEIKSGATFNNNQNLTQDITVDTKALYIASGKFDGIDSSVKVTDITFTNLADQYTYKGEVNESGYSANLRSGDYSVSIAAAGYKTSSHVAVNGKAVTKNVLVVSTNTTVTPIPLQSDIYVGYPSQAYNYGSIKEAVAAAKAMAPTKESDRITIHVAPGTYREQLIIDTPYLSFVNDTPDKEVKLTWYYGIGYKYYSADSSGYYNYENDYDKFAKSTVSKWGASTYIKSGAKGFKAENIVFEASFNKYVTDEEIEDGVQVSGGESITFERKINSDVTSKTATERSSAMALEADDTEFLNCKFIGSQDTLYTGAKINVYFKNCMIEGNTDYIFGGGAVVFDTCELRFAGYSNTAAGGYITAANQEAGLSGYLFRNCTVTKKEGMTHAAGYFGRPWGADANVVLLNTKLQDNAIITAVGWTEMSGKLPQNAKFKEYNTTSLDGKTVDVSSRTTGTVISDASSYALDAYFGNDWTPSYYTAEENSVEFAANPYVLDNGDINAPYPGHTLTACYSLGAKNDANDASTIEWYRVDKENKATLIKRTTAINKDYKLTADDQNCYIKIVVNAETASGNKGASKEYQVAEAVREGYEDPTGGKDPSLGSGINVFLAGDSTVKDYSPNGMYITNGKPQNEGSWGEYLQNFLDSSYVNVVNYANGGRSSRSFINEGSLAAIEGKISDGDYLFIQFGHNDCANGSGYLEERFAPLGTPDGNGIYPITAGTKKATPETLKKSYGDTYYSYDSGGTYKWYLKQYIDAAKKKNAIPVLVTPVSRMYYNADGTIKTHHDSTDSTTGTQVTSNNAYVAAVKQLAQEEDVLLIDGFELTKDMYMAAWAACGNNSYGTQIMAAGDSTHANKLGGFISSAYIAKDIKDKKISISKYIKMPSRVVGENNSGQAVFTVSAASKLAAYTPDSSDKYTVASEYWTSLGQSLIDYVGSDNGGTEPEEPGETSLGDVNEDGIVDSQDVSLIYSYILNNSFSGYEAYNFEVADVNEDSLINEKDAEIVMQKVLNSATVLPAKGGENPDTELPEAKLFIVGDSTGCDYASNMDTTYYYKRVGFGTRLGDYLSDKMHVVNYALSGRSSLDFLNENNYTKLLSEMSEGDYLLIAFGHNDEKTEPIRYTNPNGGKTVAGSLQHNLYENYIKPAQAKGVTPILATPIVRRTASGTWSNSMLHITTTVTDGNGITFDGGDYAGAIRALGSDLGIPVIDNTVSTKNLYDSLGTKETIKLHAWTSQADTSVDNTHLNNYGAAYVAYLIANDAKKLTNGFEAYVKETIAIPQESACLIVNPDYKEKEQGALEKSQLWTTTDPWWGTVYGDVGGQANIIPANFNIEENKDGSVNVRAGIPTSKSTGKIAANTDGIAMYFQQVDAETNFEISATANVNGIDSGNSQVAFGLMVTDYMNMDTYEASPAGNDYVVAGPVKFASSPFWTSFARVNKELKSLGTATANVSAIPKAGDSIPVKIVKRGDTYTVYYGSEEPVTTTVTREKPVDTLYVGLFASRCADITFTNINFNNEVVE